LQQRLLKTGQYIPGVVEKDSNDLVQTAAIEASSELVFTGFPGKSLLKPLNVAVAQMLPLPEGPVAPIIFHADASVGTELQVAFRISGRPENYTPEITLATKTITLHPGRNCVELQFDAVMEHAAYGFITFMKNPLVELHFTGNRVTGLLSVFNSVNKAVSNYGKQTPPEDIGMDTFEFWCPQRRPEGHNIDIKYYSGIDLFKAENVRNGIDRPATSPNAWVADWNDPQPRLTLTWQQPQQISTIDLLMDTDFDHPMESVLMSHPESVMPFCVRNYRIKDGAGNVLAEKTGNYQTLNRIQFSAPVTTAVLVIELEHPAVDVPAALFAVRCY